MARRGLTVLEVLVALALIAVLVVTLGALFLRLIGSSNKSGDSSAALQLAGSLLEETVRAAQFPPAVGPTRLLLYTHDASAAQEFTYQVSAAPVLPLGATPPLYLVDVHVWWNGAIRSGEGRLEARLERLVTP